MPRQYKNKLKKLNQKIAAAKSELEALPGKKRPLQRLLKFNFKTRKLEMLLEERNPSKANLEVFGVLFWRSTTVFGSGFSQWHTRTTMVSIITSTKHSNCQR